MERQLATITPDGTFTIPTDVQSALGLCAGSLMEITVKDGDIVLHPTPSKPLSRLRGMFAGQPSLEDEMLAMRRADEERLVQKEKEWI